MFTFNTQKTIIICLFLTVPLLLLLVFTYYSAYYLLFLSFTSWDGTSLVKKFVGLENFKTIFTNPQIFKVFLHNFAYFFVGLFQMGMALYLAIILNGKIKGRNFFKSLIFMPYIMNSVAVAFMFGYLFRFEDGAINLLLHKIGLSFLAMNWLGDVEIVNYALASVTTWKHMGLFVVIFIGALQSIPQDIYEAAELDGAGSFQLFRYITFPSMITIIELALFLNLAGSLSIFEFPFILTKGGPIGASDTFVTKTVDTAFVFNSYGLASAMGIVLIVIVIILALLQRAILHRNGDS